MGHDKDVERTPTYTKAKGGRGKLLANARALLIGELVSIGVLLAVSAVVAVLIWASWATGALGLGLTRAGLTIGVIVILGIVGSFAVGSWVGTKRSRPAGSLVVGAFVPVTFIVIVTLVAQMFSSSLMDVQSVAIAAGWEDAPDPGPSGWPHLPAEAEWRPGVNEHADQDFFESPAGHVVLAAVFFVILLATVVCAGVLGAALNKQREGVVGTRMTHRGRALASLAILGAGIATLTAALWSSVLMTGVALVDVDQSAGPEVGVNLSEVATTPEAMWGRSVTISAKVNQLVSQHVAVIGNDTPLIGFKVLIASEPELEEQLMSGPQQAANLREGDVVQVTGVVRPYDAEALEADLGVSLNEDAISGYDGSAYLDVQFINTDVPVAAPAGDKEFLDETDGYDRGVTVNDILDAPGDHVAMTVTVSGEIEGDILEPHVFTISDWYLLVVSAEPQPDVFGEATAYVTGEVGIFDLEGVEEQIGIDLDHEALSEYEGEPFILAESVHVVA